MAGQRAQRTTAASRARVIYRKRSLRRTMLNPSPLIMPCPGLNAPPHQKSPAPPATCKAQFTPLQGKTNCGGTAKVSMGVGKLANRHAAPWRRWQLRARQRLLGNGKDSPVLAFGGVTTRVIRGSEMKAAASSASRHRPPCMRNCLDVRQSRLAIPISLCQLVWRFGAHVGYLSTNTDGI